LDLTAHLKHTNCGRFRIVPLRIQKMKTTLAVRFAACLLGLAALTCSSPAQDTSTPTPPAGVQATPHSGTRGHHPAIRAAIAALERAKAEMQAAAHDYGGHRADALAACDTAIAQLKLALQYVNANAPSAPSPTP
jgi:hypothetical protein